MEFRSNKTSWKSDKFTFASGRNAPLRCICEGDLRRFRGVSKFPERRLVRRVCPIAEHSVGKDLPCEHDFLPTRDCSRRRTGGHRTAGAGRAGRLCARGDNGAIDNHAFDNNDHARRCDAQFQSLYAAARHDTARNAGAGQCQSLSTAIVGGSGTTLSAGRDVYQPAGKRAADSDQSSGSAANLNDTLRAERDDGLPELGR